jgi:hypothetical protein
VELGLTPAANLTLTSATFSDAADQAGISRRYGGIHLKQGDLDGRATGRNAAPTTLEQGADLHRRHGLK